MRWWITIFLVAFPISAFAEDAEDDKSRIAKFLESSLSGGGREVTIEGFQGALSSTVRMDSMTIADADGTWLTLKDAVLEWNRTAILAGRIEVSKLSASEIYLPRLPKTDPQPTSPETTPFALPELPVSINIGELVTDTLFLGEDLIGTDATFSIKGGLSLADGDGSAHMQINRTDGPEGRFNLDAGYSNANRLLNVDLFTKEAADGIIANLASLPGAPSLEFAIKGDGALEDFVAKIRLKSNGEERVAGFVALNVVADPNKPTPAPGEPLNDPMRVFSVDLQGDITPLFVPQYQSFFGDNVSITSVVRSFADGSTRLDQLFLDTAHFQVRGDMALAPDGAPERFALDINLGSADGKSVLLPLPGTETYLGSARLAAKFDQKMGDRWQLEGQINDFVQGNLSFSEADLAGAGEILLGEVPRATAVINADVLGIETSDEGLREALGDSISFDTELAWEMDGPVTIHSLDLSAKGMHVDATAVISDLGSNMSIKGQASANLDELSGFSKLAGRDLGGAAATNLSGEYAPLSGAFDLTLTANATNLEIGDPRVDTLARGESQLYVSAKRDGGGVVLRRVTLASPNLNAHANGTLDSSAGDLDFAASLNDISPLVVGVNGPASIEGNLMQSDGGTQATVSVIAPGDIEMAASYDDITGQPVTVKLDGEIGNLATYAASVPGSATIDADLVQIDDQWEILAKVLGSIGSNTTISGTVSQGFDDADIAMTGHLPLALANNALKPNSIQGEAAFDLRLQGKPEVDNLKGTITTSGAQFVLPELQFALSAINTQVTIEQSTANIQVTTAGSAGGNITVNGSVGMAAPFASNINIALNTLGYQMGSLLSTSVDGSLTLAGPLTAGPSVSGNIDLGPTEIRLSASALGGAGSVPEVSHLNLSSRISQTREFAGLIKEEEAAGGGGGAPVALDISVRTAERITARGLGLFSDFQGALDIVGTSTDIQTDGEFNLMRGRLDFLGKQFELTEGVIRLAGGFVPDIRIVAETKSGDTTFEIILSGNASDPQLEIISDPELPEDEMLSHLLFGKGVSNISPIQAARLASAAASLAGGGGGALGRTRRASGLDDLGLTTDEDGNTGVRAGKYINENIYTDIGIDSKGQSTINLNLDVTDSLTVKGRVDSNSDTGVGIFFRYDY